jgi:hypothetical protein
LSGGAATGESVGAVQRRVRKIRDEWALLGVAGQEFGAVQADRF